tara:strand:+ start:6019 stop:6438 length:420 start_codon:yes stop_codon:yes gene_type:complete
MGLVEINKDPTRSQLRSFALIWFPAFCALVGFLLFRKVGTTPAYAVWGTGAVLSVIGLLVPAFMRLIFVGLMYITFPLGFVVAHILLAAIYFSVLTPIGLLTRLTSYDPMGRGKNNTNSQTYWVTREERPPRKSYFRQF